MDGDGTVTDIVVQVIAVGRARKRATIRHTDGGVVLGRIRRGSEWSVGVIFIYIDGDLATRLVILHIDPEGAIGAITITVHCRIAEGQLMVLGGTPVQQRTFQ